MGDPITPGTLGYMIWYGIGAGLLTAVCVTIVLLWIVTWVQRQERKGRVKRLPVDADEPIRFVVCRCPDERCLIHGDPMKGTELTATVTDFSQCADGGWQLMPCPVCGSAMRHAEQNAWRGHRPDCSWKGGL